MWAFAKLASGIVSLSQTVAGMIRENKLVQSGVDKERAESSGEILEAGLDAKKIDADVDALPALGISARLRKLASRKKR